jgi:gas vesicle protein
MKKTSMKKAAVVGGILAGVAAAGAATAYFFGGKGGEKNRAKVKAWADKAKKEVVSELKKMENVSQKAYHSAVDMIMDKYKDLKNVDQEDLMNAAKELKSHWKSISADMKKAVDEGKKIASSTVKSAKKNVSKIAKKLS